MLGCQNSHRAKNTWPWCLALLDISHWDKCLLMLKTSNWQGTAITWFGGHSFADDRRGGKTRIVIIGRRHCKEPIYGWKNRRLHQSYASTVQKAACTVSPFHRLHVVIHCCCSLYFGTICEICTICLVSSHATGKEKTMVPEHSMAKSSIDFKSFTWFVPCGPRDVALTRCRFR